MLGEKLSQEHIKVEALEEELCCLRLQATTTSNLPWELARDLKREEEDRDAAIQEARLARREREGLRHAYCQDNPFRCCPAGATILSDFVLYYHDQIPSLP
ncbi:hypothetical protein LIER_00895 [Lithospermum erythrorhizon]|uniref:Uncharacterized protein n=1 Tax=Lithospermum erythrorhizon TaxID=34254 RepID=A0AAV3NJ08_LITER